MRRDQLGWVAVVATLLLIGAATVVVTLLGSPGGAPDGVDVVDAAPPPAASAPAPPPAPAAVPSARPSTRPGGPAASATGGTSRAGGAADRSSRRTTAPERGPRPTPTPWGVLDASAGTGAITSGHRFRGAVTSTDAARSPGCSYGVQDDRMVAAVNPGSFEGSQACGARLLVQGPGGTATVTVVGRCDACPAGGLGLSPAAFAAVGGAGAPVDAQWRLTASAPGGPVRFVYSLPSTALACAIQVRNTRNPVQTVQLRVGQEWTSLERQSDNFFQHVGPGCGGDVRAVDVYGNAVTGHPGLLPGVVQDAAEQFGAP